MRIAGSVVLVTGASSGIGAATAHRLAGAGARLVLHGRDADRLTAVAAATGGTALTVDLSGPAGARALARAAVEVAGQVDVLVSNAGRGWCGPLPAMTGAQVGEVVAVNLVSPIELTRALLPGMLARGHGRLVYVGSIAARTGVAEEAVYAASKAGVDGFAESLRFELAGTGLGVSVVVPGVVATPFFARRGRPYRRSLPRPVAPETVAAVIERMIVTGRAERHVPGWLAVPAALRVVAPSAYRWLAARFGGS
ncbi:SDR family NAD(P)-dependent oxidoreductase [Allokutzneria oryzae]|uniref:SDR family NAD(P)-dependent oxidoreductase n=1 Tax=Allokutzneria oryzae TaxID=1378989 RepID=A0ABV5ZYK9_9PSEU